MRPPRPASPVPKPVLGGIRRRPILGGLLNEYEPQPETADQPPWSSSGARQGQPGNIGYSIGKSGLINFTRSAAMELAEYGIRVNGVPPTATLPEDPETARRAPAAVAEVDLVGRLPEARLPTAADYVRPLVFLASEGSRLITGSSITVDGGALAKYWPSVPRGGQDATDP